MAIEVNSASVICSKCGRAYGRRKGYFSVNYGALYKGVGYITVCKDCVDKMYNSYLAQCDNPKDAVRRVCRKLDLYWSEKLFDAADKKNTTHTIMTGYISKLNSTTYSGKSYEDTLEEEGLLWCFGSSDTENVPTKKDLFQEDEIASEEIQISDDVVSFWGTGYTPEMYDALEQRRSYWMSRFPNDTELDIGTEALIRQICSLELDINRDRAAGRAVDKSVNALNTLLGSASLKPTQKKNEESDASVESTPFGVWIRRWENQRPIPEPDPELQDVDGIIKYISIWFLGHLCKMLGIKNTYCKLYEDELAKMRIERPEYEDEDDESMFNDIFGSDSLEDD